MIPIGGFSAKTQRIIRREQARITKAHQLADLKPSFESIEFLANFQLLHLKQRGKMADARRLARVLTLWQEGPK